MVRSAMADHRLEKCPDHDIKGFKRNLDLLVVARNIQQLGAMPPVLPPADRSFLCGRDRCY